MQYMSTELFEKTERKKTVARHRFR